MKTTSASTKRQPNHERLTSQGSLLGPELWRPDGVEPILNRLVVLGPYPTVEFFRDVVRRYNPQEVLLVVDDATNLDEVNRIRALFSSRKFQVRYASCRNGGLLHAKVYLASWGKGRATKHRLLWGSLNASRNGFVVNGEVVSAVTLEPNQERAILPYFRQISEGNNRWVLQVDTELPGRVRFHLPEFRISVDPEPETFDGWVQAGCLCYKFQRDQAFAKLSIKLRKPLPQDAFQRLFAKADLREDTDRSTFRFPYLGDVAKDEGKSIPHWRARYFVETWLGFWTSDSCYYSKKDTFTVPNEQQRKEILTLIKQSGRREQKEWYDKFFSRLRQVLSGLREVGEEPHKFFYMRQNDIDLQWYRKTAREELESHYKRARNSVFEERFTKGYEFHSLPPFRGAEAVEGGSFGDFEESLCESILNGLMRRKTTNLIVQAVRRNLGHDALDVHRWTGQELLNFLRKNWHQVGADVRAFFK